MLIPISMHRHKRLKRSPQLLGSSSGGVTVRTLLELVNAFDCYACPFFVLTFMRTVDFLQSAFIICKLSDKNSSVVKSLEHADTQSCIAFKYSDIFTRHLLCFGLFGRSNSNNS